MRIPLQFLFVAWTLMGIVWTQDGDEEDDFDMDAKPESGSDEDGEEADGGDDEEEEEEEEEEADFDADVPEAERYGKMSKCVDLVKRLMMGPEVDAEVKKMMEANSELDEEKAKAAITVHTVTICNFNLHQDETLWQKVKLPFGVHSEETKAHLAQTLFAKPEVLPELSKKQSAMLQGIMAPPKAEKRLTETEEERQERKERMKRRAEEKASGKHKEKEKKKKSRSSGGPQMDLPGGLLSMDRKGQMVYLLVVFGGIAAILLIGVKYLQKYQEEHSTKKKTRAEKKKK